MRKGLTISLVSGGPSSVEGLTIEFLTGRGECSAVFFHIKVPRVFSAQQAACAAARLDGGGLTNCN